MAIYDVIIVGAGMSGLYTAFLLKQYNPKINLLIIEKNDRKHIGGRANTEPFYGTNIAIGAGIGRSKKDRLLAKLMRHFHMPIHSYTVEHHIATTQNINVPETILKLKEAYEKNKGILQKRPQTFAKFAKHVLGQKDYTRFLNSTGFTDYENEDAYETIYEYGMEDNLGGWQAFSVPWHDLVQSLYNSVGTKHFIFGKKVTKITKDANRIIHLIADDGNAYAAKCVVLATTVDTLRRLIPQSPIYGDIEGQPFLRVYGKFDKSSVGILKDVLPRFTYVDTPLQKIILIDVEKGVYIIVYNDNASALALKTKTENTAKNCRFYETCLEQTLRLPVGCLNLIAIRSFYWQYGTHYYTPLDREKYNTREEFMRKAQRPEENVYVVGELVSRNQGWTEGALESVQEVIHEIQK